VRLEGKKIKLANFRIDGVGPRDVSDSEEEADGDDGPACSPYSPAAVALEVCADTVVLALKYTLHRIEGVHATFA